mmetsp:Transcript_135030/g.431100  ORF Transcript_135030/g.431100 Transcript_135030/m.431100 type:complete len:228 (+) Transcript_135030:684-1367(+)
MAILCSGKVPRRLLTHNLGVVVSAVPHRFWELAVRSGSRDLVPILARVGVVVRVHACIHDASEGGCDQDALYAGRFLAGDQAALGAHLGRLDEVGHRVLRLDVEGRSRMKHTHASGDCRLECLRLRAIHTSDYPELVFTMLLLHLQQWRHLVLIARRAHCANDGVALVEQLLHEVQRDEAAAAGDADGARAGTQGLLTPLHTWGLAHRFQLRRPSIITRCRHLCRRC